MTATATLDTSTALIDALRLAVKNAGDTTIISAVEYVNYFNANDLLKFYDAGVFYTDEEIRAALDNLLG